MMDIQVEARDGLALVTLTGDAMGGPAGTALHDRLRQEREAGRRNVVVDLSGIDRMNSSGLGMLIGALTIARNAGGDLLLASPGDRVLQLLTVTRMLGVFETHDSVDAAVASFAG